MKLVLLLSVLFILPTHAMEIVAYAVCNNNNARPETPKDDQRAQSPVQSPKHHSDKKRGVSSFKKKVIATGITALLATAGVASNAVAIQKSFEPLHSQILPWTGTLPANNETCTYTTRITETWFNSGNRNDCFVGRTRVPAEYCSCESTHCRVTLQECQEHDPFKQEVTTTSSISLVTLITGWLVSTFGIWCID